MIRYLACVLILMGVAHAQGTVNPGTIGQTGCYTASGTTISGCNGPINATSMSGSTLDVQINNALTISNDVFIPAGTYNLTCSSSWNGGANGWQSGDPVTSPYYPAVLLPSGSHIHGAGIGVTIINVTRGSSAASCTLFANATRNTYGSNPDIEIDHLMINWTDSNTTNYSGISIIEMAGTDRFKMHDVELSGNPNRLLNLLDMTRQSVHDNTFLLNTTNGGVLGNQAVSSARFQTATPYTLNAGEIYNNKIVEIGDTGNLGLSMVTLAQSNISFGPNNVIDVANYSATGGNVTQANTLESGDDNGSGTGAGAANIESYLHVFGNYFYGGVVRLPILNTTFEDNFVYGGSGVLATYAVSPDINATVARLKIMRNTLHCPGTGVNCGIFVAGNSVQGMQSTTVSDNTVEDGGLQVYYSAGSGNGASNCVWITMKSTILPITR